MHHASAERSICPIRTPVDARERERGVRAVVLLTTGMMVVEVVVGYLTGSMALLADGWHMATHVAALGLASAAYALSRRFAGHRAFAFGTGKIQALGGYTSAVALGLVALMMMAEAASRLLQPSSIDFAGSLPVAVLGLVVNLASYRLLHAGGHEHGHPHAHDEHDHARAHEAHPHAPDEREHEHAPDEREHEHEQAHDEHDHAPVHGEREHEQAHDEHDHAPVHGEREREHEQAHDERDRARARGEHARECAHDRHRVLTHAEHGNHAHDHVRAIDHVPARHRAWAQGRGHADDRASTPREGHPTATAHPERHPHHPHGAHHHDHNHRAAVLHVAADALTSVLAILALLAGRYLGLTWLDPMMGIVGGVVILKWGVSLCKHAAFDLLDVDLSSSLEDGIRSTLERIDDVRVSDLHVWSLGRGDRGCIISLISSTPHETSFYKQHLRRFALAHLTVEVTRCTEGHALAHPSAAAAGS